MSDIAPEIHIRPPTLADLDAVVALIVAYEQAIRGTADEANERRVVLGDWEHDDVDLSTDAWVAVLPDGQIVGYAIVFDLRSPEAAACDGYVLPAYQARGVWTRLVRLAVERLERESPSLPEHQAVRLRISIYGRDVAARALLEAEGFVAVRHHWYMHVIMDAPPVLAAAPDGIRIAPFRTDEDERAVHAVLEEAFADHWAHTPSSFAEWRRDTIARDDFDPSLWRLAWDGAEVVGAALAYQRTEQGWVRVLGVRPPWRRRGVGLALLQHVFACFYERGTTVVGLGVDTASPTGATRLYERAGMHVYEDLDTYERVLRAPPAMA
jgi:mycothiol synthase